jgi:hypothetical protein
METIYRGGRPVAGFNVGVGGLIVFAEDIEAEQARMLATAQNIDTAVDACAALDQTTRTQWKTFFADLARFAHQKVCNVPFPGRGCDLYATANLGDTTVAYEGQLQAWGKKLSTCANMPPEFEVTKSRPISLDSLVGPSGTDVLKYVVIGVAIVGGVYVTSQVIAVIRKKP